MFKLVKYAVYEGFNAEKARDENITHEKLWQRSTVTSSGDMATECLKVIMGRWSEANLKGGDRILQDLLFYSRLRDGRTKKYGKKCLQPQHIPPDLDSQALTFLCSPCLSHCPCVILLTCCGVSSVPFLALSAHFLTQICLAKAPQVRFKSSLSACSRDPEHRWRETIPGLTNLQILGQTSQGPAL